MEDITIKELIIRAVKLLHLQGYGKTTLRKRQFSFLRIERVHEQKGEIHFNNDIVAGYVRETEERTERGEIKWERCKELTKAAKQLTDLHTNGSICCEKRSFAPKLPDYYENLISQFLAHDKWSDYTRKETRLYAKLFFKWLSQEGHDDLSAVRESEMRQYLMYCAGHMSGASLNHTKRALKRMCAYLFENGIITDTCERFLSFSVPEEDKIKPAIPQSEVAATLNAIDRSTHSGARDYAMIMLAIVTGIRGIDIVNLKLQDIDWRIGEIRIIQKKTDKAIALALTTDVGEAIHDYVLNSRPKSDLDYVFLTCRAPFRNLCRSVPTSQHNRYRNAAGLPSDGVHGLRRSLGTNMVASGISVTTVAQVLGHSNFNATKQYISLDSKHLKECALSLAGIEPKRGEAQ